MCAVNIFPTIIFGKISVALLQISKNIQTGSALLNTSGKMWFFVGGTETTEKNRGGHKNENDKSELFKHFITWAIWITKT